MDDTPTIPAKLLEGAGLEPGERALLTTPASHLTDDQRLAAQALRARLAAAAQQFDAAELGRRRRAQRAARHTAMRVAVDLAIDDELTPALAAAFLELARKIAKAFKRGDPPQYDRAVGLLALDAEVSERTVHTMRRIGVRRGWFTVEARPREQLADGTWRQDPSIYRPAPVLWRAISFVLCGSYTGLQDFAETRDSELKTLTPQREHRTHYVKNGDGALRAASRTPAPSSDHAAAGDNEPFPADDSASSICSEASKGCSRQFTPQGVEPVALRQSLVRALAALSGESVAVHAGQEELLAAVDALRRLHDAESVDDDLWDRAVRARGLWAGLAYLFVLSKRFGSRKSVERPASLFSWAAFIAPKRLEDPLGQLEISFEATIERAAPAAEAARFRDALTWFEALPTDRRRVIQSRFERGRDGRTRPFATWLRAAYRKSNQPTVSDTSTKGI